MYQIAEADIARSRTDPQFKRVLLARTLERLLGVLHRLQADPAHVDRARLRDGAIMAVQLADMIRAIDDRLRSAA